MSTLTFVKLWLKGKCWIGRMNFYVLDGGIIPKWFGVAYIDPYFFRALVLPIPFNLVVGCLVKIRNWAKGGVKGAVLAGYVREKCPNCKLETIRPRLVKDK